MHTVGHGLESVIHRDNVPKQVSIATVKGGGEGPESRDRFENAVFVAGLANL